MIISKKGSGDFVEVDAQGSICGCRMLKTGKIEYRVKINGQKIWVSAKEVYILKGGNNEC